MNVELQAKLRASSGKGPARRLRSEEMVPAVLYGPKTESVSLSISANRLEKLLRDMGEEKSKLLRLIIEDGGDSAAKQVLIREIQVHPVRRRFLHVDFYEAPLDRPIVVDVPVELQGESIGVKKGGTLNLIRRLLSVRCLPAEIPEKVQIDVQSMDLGSTIYVRDLQGKVPFDLVGESNAAIVNIVSPEGKKGAEGEGE